MPGSWVDLDLSTAVFHVNGGNTYGQYTSGAITSLSLNGPDYYFPGLTLNNADSYEFEFTTTTSIDLYIAIIRELNETDAAWATPPRYFIADTYDAGPATVHTVTVGPGVESWDAGVTAGYNAVNFNHGNTSHISAIRYRDMTDPVARDRGEGISVRTTSPAFWAPPVLPVPAPVGVTLPQVRTVARVVDDVVTVGGSVRLEHRTESVPALRERVLFGNRDVTWDVAQIPTTRLIQPLTFGNGGTLTFPQYPYADDPPTWLKRGKTVRVQLVDADDEIVVPDYWVGFAPLDPYPNQEGSWSIDLDGDATGRLSLIKVPAPRFPKLKDPLDRVRDALLQVGRRAHPRNPTSGVRILSRGGMSGLDHVNEHMQLAVTPDGVQKRCYWDPTRNGYAFGAKDAATIAATVYFDQELVVPNLMPAPIVNRVWATGVTNNGERVVYVEAPGILQGEVPAFPGALTEGASGDDVTVLISQLIFTGFMSDDDRPGGYDSDVTDAVERLQDRAGLTVTGDVNEATWAALWDQDSHRKGVHYIREVPAVQRKYTEEWLKSSTGARLERNPDFDPHHIKYDADYDMGRAGSRQQITRWARRELTPTDEVAWSGTIRFHSGIVAGEHNPDDPFTEADVFDPRLLREGDNLWAPRFDGGRLLPVVGIERGPGYVDALVDTNDDDTMKAWERFQRNLESQTNPAHLWSGRVRQSEIRNDTVTEWVDFCGKLEQKEPLVEGWNEPIEIFSGTEGTISRILTELLPARAYAFTVTSKPGTTARWANLIPNPLAEVDPGDPEWWELDAVRDFLESKGVVYAAGTFKEPCGYKYARHTSPDTGTATAATLSGVHVDDGSYGYRTIAEPLLYVRFFVQGGTSVLQPGHIFRQQLDSSGT